MSYANGNYCAFYVSEPFSESSLNAYATPDFNYYCLIKAWKSKDSTFPFIDSHSKTYSVRDGSDWESTLKPRLRERLRNSKNIVLFLSKNTKNSKALREEIDYGINDLELPVIIVYPDYADKASLRSGDNFKQSVIDLWDSLPILRDSMHKVPTLHIPMSKDILKDALLDKDLMINSKSNPTKFYYN
ncbi:toll/interleukin-1 receptor domain-containing protein [Aeromonas dhakensis]|nr:toll/interleukin-1 receptor domain-containing protein [Aeromonas dhakensis]MDD9305408.1 toll/interleukin-1 receptor domain-containing protein [Aeromonas hydrophila]WPS56785.1 toll/interleukin-1 receptor domain-containing protein [Aeromonas dhakensis]CAD7492154.1 hypothetical protein KBAD45_29170 [Aeromonas dhakensis]CAD7510101.1 hypothetical protein KBAD50_13350 [Aeromonas dhakensis]CAD7510382.1 hypothetical protein KBAD49_13350 [Aeromonas dhakensis]